MAMNDPLDALQSAVESDPALWSDFVALCDCGGRRAGTDSEAKALLFAEKRLSEVRASVRVERVPYAGWRCKDAALTLPDGTALACNPLLGSQSTSPEGVTAEVVDLGRGTADDFADRARKIGGRLVLVRHEYPFSSQHIHRRRKLAWAMERGAAGFIIANPQPGAGPVTGSSGRAGQQGIPAVGTDLESAEMLSRADGAVHLKSIGEDYPAQTSVLSLDLPGGGPGWVVLSAHIDGHDLAESAMDNATGVAAALAVVRACASRVAECRRGLRVCLFSAEEWALAGSKHYLDSLSEAERNEIALNVNLDTVGGDDQLTALTSEYAKLDQYIKSVARATAIQLNTYAPIMANSDHYNFARHGIPAMRLVAGFDRPETNIRYILTKQDTREKVKPFELRGGARVAAMIVWRALTMSDSEIRELRKS
jgi:Iap family predicted aminopeptidase